MLTFKREILDMNLAHEVYELAKLSMQETGLDVYFENVDINLELYKKLQDVDSLCIVTAREHSNKLVGFSIYIVSNSMTNIGKIQADNNTIFLKEEYRKGKTGAMLMKKSEEILKSIDVSIVVHKTSLKKDLSRLFERMNYTFIEKVYAKNI